MKLLAVSTVQPVAVDGAPKPPLVAALPAVPPVQTHSLTNTSCSWSLVMFESMPSLKPIGMVEVPEMVLPLALALRESASNLSPGLRRNRRRRHHVDDPDEAAVERG